MKSLSNQDPVIVRRKRIEAGLSQGALAAAADISQSYLSMLEKGSASASAPVLKRLAQVLSCEIAELMRPEPAIAGSAA